jgi:hypothetical protein
LKVPSELTLYIVVNAVLGKFWTIFNIFNYRQTEDFSHKILYQKYSITLVNVLMHSCRIQLSTIYCRIYLFMKGHMHQHLQVGKILNLSTTLHCVISYLLSPATQALLQQDIIKNYQNRERTINCQKNKINKRST